LTAATITIIEVMIMTSLNFYFNVLGDLSYGDCVGRLWDSYGEMIEPLSSQIPWMVSPGNHEIEHIFVNKTNAAGEKKLSKLFDY
jgi:Calcineurin-like phosphoesterase